MLKIQSRLFYNVSRTWRWAVLIVIAWVGLIFFAKMSPVAMTFGFLPGVSRFWDCLMPPTWAAASVIAGRFLHRTVTDPDEHRRLAAWARLFMRVTGTIALVFGLLAGLTLLLAAAVVAVLLCGRFEVPDPHAPWTTIPREKQ